MKIEFNLNKRKYLGYAIIVDSSCILEARCDDKRKIDFSKPRSMYFRVYKIAEKIRSLFPSALVISIGRRLFIDFEDSGDEANFLLWVSVTNDIN